MQRNRRCGNCLRDTHATNDCPYSVNCLICNGRHHSTLHADQPSNSYRTAQFTRARSYSPPIYRSRQPNFDFRHQQINSWPSPSRFQSRYDRSPPRCEESELRRSREPRFPEGRDSESPLREPSFRKALNFSSPPRQPPSGPRLRSPPPREASTSQK